MNGSLNNLVITNDKNLLKNEASIQIKTNGAVFIEGEKLKEQEFFSKDSWNEFSSSWNALTIDKYMGDNGKYRFRRFSEFCYSSENGDLSLLPHKPYSQPSYINSLNGGIERHFDPLEDYVVKNEFFTGYLKWCAEVFNQTEKRQHNWNIKIHPYRIFAQEGVAGLPTPEGIHRDGVSYITIMMVQRNNIVGGESTIYDNEKNEIGTVTLNQPLDVIMADDEITMHGTTAIQVDVSGKEAYRDVLVAAFTKE